MAPLKRQASFSYEFSNLITMAMGTSPRQSSSRPCAPDRLTFQQKQQRRGRMASCGSTIAMEVAASSAEFAAFMNARHDRLRAIFEALDHSKTNRINVEDVKWALQEAGIPHLEADVDRVLKRMGGGDTGVTSDGAPSRPFSTRPCCSRSTAPKTC